MVWDVTLSVTLALRGPVISMSSEPGAPGISTPAARSTKASGERLIIPGPEVKGRLREALESLSTSAGWFVTSADIERWLGQGSDDLPDSEVLKFLPRRGGLVFSDFETSEETPGQTICRIRIETETRAADPGMFQVIEAPFAPGRRTEFSGEIRFLALERNAIQDVRRLLETGFALIPAFGGLKSIGFGKCLSVRIEERSRRIAVAVPESGSAAETLSLAIGFDKPLCISRNQPAQNLFESAVEIPGGVLKGAMASLLLRLAGKTDWCPIGPALNLPGLQRLVNHFEKVRFTHSFPSKVLPENRRPVTPPLSLVKNEKTVWDAALATGPFLLNGEAPKFAIDWKDGSDLWRHFGWPDVQRDLRVRTAIDPETRSAKEDHLFALDMVLPWGLEWLGSVDLGDVPVSDRASVYAEIRWLLETFGFPEVGKTKAQGKVRFPPVSPSAQAPLRKDGLAIITLQTDALLTSPGSLGASSRGPELHAAYDRFWSTISAGSLSLKRFFAQQSLAGGRYLNGRFREGTGPYVPFVLTRAGSVFVLDVLDDEGAAAHLSGWAAHGLPLPEGFESTGQSPWRTCPFVRENGYGEIAVNLREHDDMAVSKAGAGCEYTPEEAR
ncbi:MAG: hypothetical protein L6R30_22045 [Thermoanaerobaculia bacterium]|nr:hypothetical protein [Thermoanaerobaculia bacterium]